MSPGGIEGAPEQQKSGGKWRKWTLLLLTNLISIVCLWWVLKDINWGDFRGNVRDIKWLWVLLAVVADIAVYFLHGIRWSLLLAPVERIPVLRSVRAIYVGLFANEVLPLRTGEVLRCYLQARWSSIPFSVTLSSALIERIFDGFFLVACLLVTVKRVPSLPQFITDAAWILGAFVAAGAIAVGIAMFHKHRAHEMFSSESKLHRHVRVLIADLYMIGHSRYLYFSAAMTLAYLLMQIVPIYAVMRAYDLADPSWGVAAVLMIVLRLGSAVPQAPGNVGAFQYIAAVILFKVFHYDLKFSKEFSLVLWAVVTLPLMIAGLVALIVTGAHIGELNRNAKSEMPAGAKTD